MNYGKILIVDDTPENIDVARGLLEAEGFEVFVATNGEKAISRAELISPELILLDIRMPVMDGYQACKLLKQNPKTADIPIIYLTAQADTESIIKGFKTGAVDYITKPFNAEEVLARVNTHLSISRLQKKLDDSNQTKDKFFSIIAHDLKNPFSSILGFIDMIIEDYDELSDEEKITFLKETKMASSNAYKLLENLLNWSRSQLGTLNVSRENFHLKDITDRIIELTLPQAKTKKVHLLSEVDDTIRIFADSSMIETVIRNLVTNALKYSNEEGIVRIQAFEKDDEVEICIKDNGIGMDEYIQKRLFTLNNSVSVPGTAEERGTGLGLIICKEFIEKNGGHIAVESSLGKGSVFKFSLPINSD